LVASAGASVEDGLVEAKALDGVVFGREAAGAIAGRVG
jgi:hypothetical protein